ncbi:hypothetical protein CLV56_2487 [Mumia flava]|uniref:Uncharacterized protein n=1 Tax=Mumia flava TaxID=1348852 RepID=A0A0B2BF39_9ACTN|nr:hypothetical protein [Mumia flava]PJJ58240.1 hypothetical protein CLV56_2487 [Mumia flava]
MDEQRSDQDIDDARERMIAAADQLADRLREHARTVAALDPADEDALLQANDRLTDATLEFEDAQFSLTGTLPYGLDEAEEESFGPDPTGAGPTRMQAAVQAAVDSAMGEDDVEEIEVDAALSIVTRHDYVILDAQDVVQAAQDAAGLPDGDPRVADLGVALAELAGSAGTWDRLERHPGIRATGGITTVIAHEDLLIGDPDDWPDDISVDGDLLYTQIDAY